jgi:pyruvate/2-oxoglutarate dehydrogenase complex dihydrolipoamide acyltransferase (E2) component
MTVNVILPKQGLQMEEGTIVKWWKKEGETVKEGETLFEMETDKVTMEVPAPASGTVQKILKAEGETVPVAEVVAIIEQ